MTAPEVSFVVLNWHAEAATRECLESIQRQAGPHRYEVIVVDNESSPASRAALSDGPWQLVCLERNRGFAGGMNAGAAAARGEFVALLNNDATLAEDWLATALAAASEPSVGVVGGRSLSPAPGEPGSTLPRVDPRGFSELLSVDARRAAVASVDGGHLLIRRAAWDQLGGFDEDFFAYYEELDLNARALALGWQVIYEPALRVVHHRGLSSDRIRWRRTYLARRNRVIWLAKHFPEREWRRAVRDAVLEYLARAARGLVSREAPAADRVADAAASLATVGWIATHLRRLAGKRRATIAAGQHDPGYRERLRELYEPAPLAPALLAAAGSERPAEEVRA